jgi:hypothetical protein
MDPACPEWLDIIEDPWWRKAWADESSQPLGQPRLQKRKA